MCKELHVCVCTLFTVAPLTGGGKIEDQKNAVSTRSDWPATQCDALFVIAPSVVGICDAQCLGNYTLHCLSSGNGQNPNNTQQKLNRTDSSHHPTGTQPQPSQNPTKSQPHSSQSPTTRA